MASPNTPKSVNYARMWRMIWPASKGTFWPFPFSPGKVKGPRPAHTYRGAIRDLLWHSGCATERKRARRVANLRHAWGL